MNFTNLICNWHFFITGSLWLYEMKKVSSINTLTELSGFLTSCHLVFFVIQPYHSPIFGRISECSWPLVSGVQILKVFISFQGKSGFENSLCKTNYLNTWNNKNTYAGNLDWGGWEVCNWCNYCINVWEHDFQVSQRSAKASTYRQCARLASHKPSP